MTMHRFCRGLLLVVLFSYPGFAKPAQPIDAVNTFFDAMSKNDADLASSVVVEGGIIYGYAEGDESADLIRLSIGQFLDGWKARTTSVLERIWDVQVLVHERLAVVWSPYDFFVDGEFHHCGVDSFNLIRTGEGWKITGVTFSVETKSCEPSPLGPPDFG